TAGRECGPLTTLGVSVSSTQRLPRRCNRLAIVGIVIRDAASAWSACERFHPNRARDSMAREGGGADTCEPADSASAHRAWVQASTWCHSGAIFGTKTCLFLPNFCSAHKPAPKTSKAGNPCCNWVSGLLSQRGRRDSNPQPPDRQSGTLTN